MEPKPTTIKLVNQGTYGCVYHPGLACNGRIEKMKFITKIQRNSSTVQNEIRISSLVKKIPGYSHYFAPIIASCPAAITKSPTDGCRVVEKNPGDSFVSNRILYVGKYNISDYILAEANTVNKFWTHVYGTHRKLHRAIKKLNAAGIVHYDVKYNNIMYSPRAKSPIFIDFGLSMHVPSLKASGESLHKAFYTFNTYNYWCVEICMFNYAFSGLGYDDAYKTKVSMSDIELVLEVFFKGKPDDHGSQSPNDVFQNALIKKYVPEFYGRCRGFFAKYVGQTWVQMYEELMYKKEVWRRWDDYGLCACYLFILEEYAAKQSGVYSQLMKSAKFQTYMNTIVSTLVAMPDQHVKFV